MGETICNPHKNIGTGPGVGNHVRRCSVATSTVIKAIYVQDNLAPLLTNLFHRAIIEGFSV